METHDEVRPRPPLLRALGSSDPPEKIECDGWTFQRAKIFKHDSWAATALYQNGQQSVVCKFNRRQSIGIIPMEWLGRWLAVRESQMLARLADVKNVPALCGPVSVQGRPARHAVAHVFVAGQPLKIAPNVDGDFFDQLWVLLANVHEHGIAYVDLHKAENVVVGEDGQPYLIDFQVSVWLPRVFVLNRILRTLQNMDRYHFARHKLFRCPELCDRETLRLGQPPWWLRVHRSIARPLRQFRRQLLVRLGIRRAEGKAQTELFPEEGHSKAA